MRAVWDYFQNFKAATSTGIYMPSLLMCNQISQSYLNDVHLVPSVVLIDNELLTKVPMDIDIWKMYEENILTAWQTLVSLRALIGWLQVRGCRLKSWIFSSFTYFSNMLCAVKLRVLSLMTYWYTGSAFHQIPQSLYVTKQQIQF